MARVKIIYYCPECGSEKVDRRERASEIIRVSMAKMGEVACGISVHNTLYPSYEAYCKDCGHAISL